MSERDGKPTSHMAIVLPTLKTSLRINTKINLIWLITCLVFFYNRRLFYLHINETYDFIICLLW